ncbi:hypothetical protein [Mycobacteroides abscessus]|uniref:hypothetical protein n=1 Tax=Mycobacteroides abscessus TaxID=36809 RepID=UPI0013F5AEEC|nr:hypothetical protein [Mycobacteroides abscessus]
MRALAFEYFRQLAGVLVVKLDARITGRVLGGELAQRGDLLAQVRDQVVLALACG